VKGYFTECSGLGSEHEVIEHKVITEKGQEVILKIPGRLKWENITLKRGITSSMDIWDWRKRLKMAMSTAPATTARLSCSTRPCRGGPLELRARLAGQVTGPQPKADSNEIGVEELTAAQWANAIGDCAGRD
jgi:phage tail-like protein